MGSGCPAAKATGNMQTAAVNTTIVNGNVNPVEYPSSQVPVPNKPTVSTMLNAAAACAGMPICTKVANTPRSVNEEPLRMVHIVTTTVLTNAKAHAPSIR